VAHKVIRKKQQDNIISEKETINKNDNSIKLKNNRKFE